MIRKNNSKQQVILISFLGLLLVLGIGLTQTSYQSIAMGLLITVPIGMMTTFIYFD